MRGGDVVDDDVDVGDFDSVLSCLCKKYDQDQDLNHLLHVIFQEYWTGPLHCFNLDIWLSPFFVIQITCIGHEKWLEHN